jgi:hypothetical protein
VLVLRDVTAAVLERDGLHGGIQALRLYGIGGLTDTSNLGVGVNDRGDGIVVDAVLLAKDIVDGNVVVNINGKETEVSRKKCGKGIQLTISAKTTSKIEILFTDCTYLANMDKKQELIQTIAKFQMGNDKKGMMFKKLLDNTKKIPSVSKDMAQPIEEILKLHR